MIYEQLVDFVQHRMRMSRVYQPVMLMLVTLLRRDDTHIEAARATLGQKRGWGDTA
jgi:hypothetical protein